jgi:hypothetical protein
MNKTQNPKREEEKETKIIPFRDLMEIEEANRVSNLVYNKEEYQKRIDELKALLESEGLNEVQRKKIKTMIALYQMALGLEIPVCGITILGGNPYINTAGLLYKTIEVSKSHGGIKRISAEPLKDKDGNLLISQEPGKPAFFIGRVEFNDGTVFEDIGEASIENIRMSTIHPFLNSMAARRATNRAMRLATGIGLVSAEEIAGEESVEKETPETRLLTEKEMREIEDLIVEIEAIDSPEKLEEVRKKLSERKPSLTEPQILTLAKAFKKKQAEYGIF